MPWQDDLERLESELSAKRISTEEYRRLRDDLLAEASSQATTSLTMRRPDAAQPSAREEAKAERTTPMRPVTQTGPTGDRQPVPPQHNGPVTVARKPHPATENGGPGPAGDKRPSPEITPLQAPRAVAVNRSTHGAEVFDSAATRGKPVLRIAVVLLVVALAGAVVGWQLWRSKADGTQAADEPATASQTATIPPRTTTALDTMTLLANLPALPGTVDIGRTLTGLDTASQIGILSTELVDRLHSENIRQIAMTASHEGAVGFGVLVLPATYTEQVLRDIADFQRNGLGFTAAAQGAMPAPIMVLELIRDRNVWYRCLYRSNGSVVIVAVSASAIEPSAVSGLRAKFDSLAGAAVVAMPPDK